ncbi:hypothetical protein [Nocardioides solisilvae]|uniref:hypothetical protein n=1 Tax=Nocardioides solisilvae TaxID=1542435 RepID=UPI000D748C29|nr:hypothetical protein [Nocardioides solisilvae]
MDALDGLWLDLLGWGGSALLVYSLLQSRVLRFRLLNLAACAVLVVFNAVVEVWPMVGMNVVLCGINAWFIVRLVRGRHDPSAYEVLEVRPNDEYLRHVLRVHEADILQFQPDFVWDPHREDHRAFLVQLLDETVGVVLLRLQDDEAYVVLDYVTPRFRDFSPGEFVWRHSQFLREGRIQQVVTSPSMVAPYYDRVGFTPRGDAFVLRI